MSWQFVPMDEWPGEDVTEEDVWLASLDERDWFNYPSRLQAFDDYRNVLDMGWRNRQRGRWGRPYPPPRFEFGQIGVVGDMGTGKTTIVGSEAYYYGQWGYPFFHVKNPDNNRASWLMGKKIHPAQLYEVIEVIPMFSLLGVDEGHTMFESGLGMASGIRGWQIQGAGLRKAMCRIYIPTAMMVMLAPIIRRSCSEVWRPLQVKVNDYQLPEEKPPPHSDPANFIQVWDVWKNFPFRQRDIIEARPKRRNGGLGPPHDRMWRSGEIVRLGFKLTDTFLRVAGAQAQQFALKEQQTEARAQRREEQDGAPTLSPPQEAILKAVWQTCNNGYSTHFTADSIAFETGMRLSPVRQILGGFLGNLPDVKTGSQYRCDRIKLALPMKFNIPDEWNSKEDWYDDC